jgi:hypothetical protein
MSRQRVKRTRRVHTPEFKAKTVNLVERAIGELDQGTAVDGERQLSIGGPTVDSGLGLHRTPQPGCPRAYFSDETKGWSNALRI